MIQKKFKFQVDIVNCAYGGLNPPSQNFTHNQPTFLRVCLSHTYTFHHTNLVRSNREHTESDIFRSLGSMGISNHQADISSSVQPERQLLHPLTCNSSTTDPLTLFKSPLPNSYVTVSPNSLFMG